MVQYGPKWLKLKLDTSMMIIMIIIMIDSMGWPLYQVQPGFCDIYWIGIHIFNLKKNLISRLKWKYHPQVFEHLKNSLMFIKRLVLYAYSHTVKYKSETT